LAGNPKESRGPRAALNALARITTSYDERIEANARELELARTQLHGSEARLGWPFAHAAYLDELTGLRDRLKVALSSTPADGEPTAAELAERIKALKVRTRSRRHRHGCGRGSVRRWSGGAWNKRRFRRRSRQERPRPRQ
jgi:hypothetical protein